MLPKEFNSFAALRAAGPSFAAMQLCHVIALFWPERPQVLQVRDGARCDTHVQETSELHCLVH